MATRGGYRIEFKPSAEKALGKLSRQEQERVASAIDALAEEPIPSGAEPLKGFKGVYRIRVGSVRVIYRIEGRRLVVLVLAIGRRDAIYKRIRRRRS